MIFLLPSGGSFVLIYAAIVQIAPKMIFLVTASAPGRFSSWFPSPGLPLVLDPALPGAEPGAASSASLSRAQIFHLSHLHDTLRVTPIPKLNNQGKNASQKSPFPPDQPSSVTESQQERIHFQRQNKRPVLSVLGAPEWDKEFSSFPRVFSQISPVTVQIRAVAISRKNLGCTGRECWDVCAGQELDSTIPEAHPAQGIP